MFSPTRIWFLDTILHFPQLTFIEIQFQLLFPTKKLDSCEFLWVQTLWRKSFIKVFGIEKYFLWSLTYFDFLYVLSLIRSLQLKCKNKEVAQKNCLELKVLRTVLSKAQLNHTGAQAMKYKTKSLPQNQCMKTLHLLLSDSESVQK